MKVDDIPTSNIIFQKQDILAGHVAPLPSLNYSTC